MNGALKTLSLAVLVGCSLFACVPAKQYNLLKDNNAKCEDERARLKRDNDSLNVKARELASANMVLQREKAALISDSTKRQIDFANLKDNNQKLQDRYDDLNAAHEALLKGTQSESKRLLAEIQRAQSLLMQREDSLRNLEGQLNSRSSKLSSAQTAMDSLLLNLNEKNAALVELQAMLAKKDSISKALRQKVKDALIGFDGKGLTVTQKNGMVYVSMEDKLLFKSGSFDIDSRGAAAIHELAKVLAQNPDINIMVEGHTDDVPYKGRGELKDNWDLSVKRATTVVRLLTENSEINPSRVTGSGRSQYLPIEADKTSLARQKNRRTEIILTPNLDELMQIVDKY